MKKVSSRQFSGEIWNFHSTRGFAAIIFRAIETGQRNEMDFSLHKSPRQEACVYLAQSWISVMDNRKGNGAINGENHGRDTAGNVWVQSYSVAVNWLWGVMQEVAMLCVTDKDGDKWNWCRNTSGIWCNLLDWLVSFDDGEGSFGWFQNDCLGNLIRFWRWFSFFEHDRLVFWATYGTLLIWMRIIRASFSIYYLSKTFSNTFHWFVALLFICRNKQFQQFKDYS